MISCCKADNTDRSEPCYTLFFKLIQYQKKWKTNADVCIQCRTESASSHKDSCVQHSNVQQWK